MNRTLLTCLILLSAGELVSSSSPGAAPEFSALSSVAPKPLYRDPVYDGAADPVVIWNRAEQRWFMLYTNRRANKPGLRGVSWVHGTKIGIAESVDNGVTWTYRGTTEIPLGGGEDSHWAPDIVYHHGLYHMFLSFVPGMHEDWGGTRFIHHLTSQDLIHWKDEGRLDLASDRVIDAGLLQMPDGRWRLWYNNEPDRKAIYLATSPDLYAWTDRGKVIGDQAGEGPKVFRWKGKYWMIVDQWEGLGVYRSDDADQWERQPNNILAKPGSGKDDQVKGGHADVVVNAGRAYLFYFTHPGRRGPDANTDGTETRRSSIQVVELEHNDGWLTCDRDLPTHIDLRPPNQATQAEANELAWRKFRFGSGQPPSGYSAVASSAVYSPTTGFGFEPGAELVTHSDSVSSSQPFFFSVKVAEGNYRVRITFGGEEGPSVTTVKAECRRLMLENIETPPGEFVTREIMVNVRTPYLGLDRAVRLKPREKEAEWVSWDEKLTLEFNGRRPCLRSIEIVAVPAVPTVFLAGDSTVSDQALEPWNSWGQMLPRFFGPGVAVANHAESGESIRSSMGARRFEKIFSTMKSGDWLLVQFGHNDMKDRAPDASATYRANLKKIIAETRKHGGTPVLITSMERKSGVKAPTLAGYPDAVRAVAREEQVALIDLNTLSLVLYRALGPNLDQAFQDGTHHNNYGSYLLAQCVAAGMETAGLGLVEFLVAPAKDFDPSRPMAFEEFQLPPSPQRSLVKPNGD